MSGIDYKSDADKLDVSEVWQSRKDTEKKVRIFCAHIAINKIWFDCLEGGGRNDLSVLEFLQSYEPKPRYTLDTRFLRHGIDKAKQAQADAKIKHSHYHKDVSGYETIDIYAVCKIFDVQDTSGCLQHAIKKLLVTGKRGHKDRKTDIQNAIDTLNRLLDLESE